MGTRQFYVLLKGLPAESLFWQLCKNDPVEPTSQVEVERITALARS